MLPMGDDRYVTRNEWTLFQAHQDELELHKRVDRLERIIDRFAGPVVITIVLLGAIGAASSVVSVILAVSG